MSHHLRCHRRTICNSFSCSVVCTLLTCLCSWFSSLKIEYKSEKTYLTRLVTRRPASPASSISFPQVLQHYIKMKIFFCIRRHDDNKFSLSSGAPDPPRRCAMGNRTASSLTFAVSLFKLCGLIIRGFRLNTFPSNPRQVNRHHYCSPLASKGFLLHCSYYHRW